VSAALIQNTVFLFYIEIFISFFTLHDALQAPLMRKKSVMELNAVFGEKSTEQK